MDKKDFQDLLKEIDSMSIEEYCKWHEKAQKMENKKIIENVCTDKCKHARYIKEGDFICAITKNVTIYRFCPMVCQCPNKHKEENCKRGKRKCVKKR